MNETIGKFLNVLENWKDNFKIKDFDVTKDDDLSQIVSMQREKNIKGLLDVWEGKLGQDYFELPHPEHKDVKTRAVYNVRYGMCNFVVMNDATSAYPWIFGQCVNFIDIVITETAISKASLFNNHAFLPFIHRLSELPDHHFEHKDCSFGLWVSQTRPYHYFYDQLKFFLHFKTVNKIVFKNSFFSFKHSLEENEIDDEVFLFPTVLGNNFKKDGLAKTLNEKMEVLVYQESMSDISKIIKEPSSKYNLVLWLGITGQKRSWLQQVDGYISIIKQLEKQFPDIKVYVDGLTAMDGETLNNADDNEIVNKIEQAFKNKSNVEVVSLVGKDYRTKICYCSTSDIFIANAGTGAIVPLRFTKKPGVLHRNTKLFTFPDNYPDTVKRTDSKFIVDVDIDGKNRGDFLSYHTPWQHIFNLSAEVINKIKGSKIKNLKVPEMESLIKEYNHQESSNIRIDELLVFNKLGSKIKSQDQGADILREVALSFEKSGDLLTALTIMKKASQLRPKGDFIKNKVSEYLSKLDNQ
jgi:hypothetical protein